MTTALADLAVCDLVVEAVPEDAALKRELWRGLEPRVRRPLIFASNTSSLSITEMAAATGRADRFVGLHFFNPVPLMPLVEVVRGDDVGGDFDAPMAFVRRLGKEPIVARDRSGFIVNRLLVPYLLDAVRALEQGVRLGARHRPRHAARRGPPHGSARPARFRGARYHRQHRGDHVRGVSRARYAPPPLLRPDGGGRAVWPEIGTGVL